MYLRMDSDNRVVVNINNPFNKEEKAFLMSLDFKKFNSEDNSYTLKKSDVHVEVTKRKILKRHVIFDKLLNDFVLGKNLITKEFYVVNNLRNMTTTEYLHFNDLKSALTLLYPKTTPSVLLDKLLEVEKNIYGSYSGKSGCMCGCNGNYKYKKEYRETVEELNGYKLDDEDINDSSVNRMINTFKKLLSDDKNYIEFNEDGKEGNFFYKTENRYNVLYFVR